MRRPSPILVALLAAACTGEVGGPVTLCGDLEVSPSLKDIGTQPVGARTDFTVTLTALVADVTVTNIEVLPIGNHDYFGTDDWFAVYRDGADEPDPDASRPLIIDKDETVEVPAWFFPLVDGYYRAQMQISGNFCDEGDIQAEVRGRADTPAASCYPLTVDFGQVDVGDPIEPGFVAVVNDSDLPLTVTDVRTSDEEARGQFVVNQSTTFVIEPRQTYELELGFDAAVTAPAAGRAAIFVGNEPICNISLRGNNCEQGVPAAYDQDGDGFTTCGGDCDDDVASIHPGATEVANALDDDCDGVVDNGTSTYDDDGDGYCDDPGLCAGSALPGDCNDGDPEVNPGADEIMGDGIDNDCDGQVDGGTLDFDGDGYTAQAGDCDVQNATVYPGAPELPDGIDNDCDLRADEGTALYDDDGDGYCEGLPSGGRPCTDGTLVGDCNDADDRTHPNAPELEDWRDNDCDGDVDEGTRNADDDGDGYTENANPPDCNDNDASIGPAALEIPGDGIDNDCNPATPDTRP